MATTEETRVEELTAFYKKHNPEKAGEAAALIKGYPFESIVASLESKYGKELIGKELPTWAAAAAKASAEAESLRMAQITEKLERTTVEDFTTFTEQLADMKACMAEGGVAALKAKHAQTAPMSDEQLAQMIAGMQEVADLGSSDGVVVGSKVGQTFGDDSATETFTVTANVEIPKDKAPGDKFSITLPNGSEVPITVPEGTKPGDVLQLNIQLPKDQEEVFKRGAKAHEEAKKPKGETFQVVANVEIPKGKAPGDKFSITLPNGAEVPITVPAGAKAGEMIELKIDMPKDQEAAFKAASTEAAAAAKGGGGAAGSGAVPPAPPDGPKAADIAMVVEQTGVSVEEATKALSENGNDVVEAIMVIEEAAEAE